VSEIVSRYRIEVMMSSRYRIEVMMSSRYRIEVMMKIDIELMISVLNRTFVEA